MPNLAVYERNTKKKGMPNAESSHARCRVLGREFLGSLTLAYFSVNKL